PNIDLLFADPSLILIALATRCCRSNDPLCTPATQLQVIISESRTAIVKEMSRTEMLAPSRSRHARCGPAACCSRDRPTAARQCVEFQTVFCLRFEARST